MWGQVETNHDTTWATGIIPMRVGTSLSHTFFSFPTRDHPHACGDKRLRRVMPLSLTGIIPMRVGTSRCDGSASTVMPGSSPCVWGQVYKPNRYCRANGIIPMRVGTSCYVKPVLRIAEDHPHACGDKV